MGHDPQTLKRVSEAFDLPGRFVDAQPYGSGHINDTYRARWQVNGRCEPFILQRINHRVFAEPRRLMDNILRVTGHLRRAACGDGARATLQVIPARDGGPLVEDAGGQFWRMYVFIRDAQTVDVCSGAGQAYQAALAFGRFQAALADLPGGRLHETIAGFHHTPRRFAALEAVVERDAAGRVESARRDIAFCRERRPLSEVLVSAMEAGAIPERTVHNDAKINNVMLDCRTGQGVCVIDLDTVMAGCALYDFGDLVRTVTRPVAEDEPDLGKVAINLDLFESLVRGYLDSARPFLTPAEIGLMVAAGKLITFTIGIRFLTDYLAGDTYFKVHRPGQNLDRARVQFAMVASMERQESQMDALVRKYAAR